MEGEYLRPRILYGRSSPFSELSLVGVAAKVDDDEMLCDGGGAQEAAEVARGGRRRREENEKNRPRAYL